MFSIVSKMKMLKKEFSKLNKKCGNVFDKVNFLREEVARVQTELDNYPDNDDIRLEHANYLKALKDAIYDEECFLKQKAKVHWLKEGDQNSAYFHKVIRGRLNRNGLNLWKICMVLDMKEMKLGSSLSNISRICWDVLLMVKTLTTQILCSATS